MKTILLVMVGMCALAIGSAKLYLHGEHRQEKVMRYARMVDTEAQHSQVKSHHYYNTYGTFVDRETGLRFRDSIGDSLYRQFERDGNKPIEVSWPYSIDKREQTSIGMFYEMFAIIGWLIVAVGMGVCIASVAVRWKARRDCKDSWFGE